MGLPTSPRVPPRCVLCGPASGLPAVRPPGPSRPAIYSPILTYLQLCCTLLQWELVEGMDLLDYLNSRGGMLAEAEAAPLFAQLVHGMRLIHEAGLVHRGEWSASDDTWGVVAGAAYLGGVLLALRLSRQPLMPDHHPSHRRYHTQPLQT